MRVPFSNTILAYLGPIGPNEAVVGLLESRRGGFIGTTLGSGVPGGVTPCCSCCWGGRGAGRFFKLRRRLDLESRAGDVAALATTAADAAGRGGAARFFTERGVCEAVRAADEGGGRAGAVLGGGGAARAFFPVFVFKTSFFLLF